MRQPRQTETVVSLGGNALGSGRVDVDPARALEACRPIVEHLLPRPGQGLLVVHGNGPQVGAASMRARAARDRVPPGTLDMHVAETQGTMGARLVQAFERLLWARGDRRPVVAVITHVLVDREDVAFRDPVKPVGALLDDTEAAELHALGVAVRPDGAGAFRRVVPSPRPRSVPEAPAIGTLLEVGALVVAGGGGGIPLYAAGSGPAPVEAVVDKDHTAALLAGTSGARRLVHLTAIDAVYGAFGRPDQHRIHRLTASHALALMGSGAFARGSMEPKVRSCYDFVHTNGEVAIITDAPHLAAALRGTAGTRIVAD